MKKPHKEQLTAKRCKWDLKRSYYESLFSHTNSLAPILKQAVGCCGVSVSDITAAKEIYMCPRRLARANRERGIEPRNPNRAIAAQEKSVPGKLGIRERQRLPSTLRLLTFSLVICGLSVVGGVPRVSAQECPDPAPQTSGSHSFRRLGETIDVPVALGDCQAISLIVRWANGRNNGSLFNLTFFDSDNRPLYTKQISAFLTGQFEFPLSSFDYQPNGSLSVMSIPTLVTIQAVPPFGLPAVLSYTVTRANHRPRASRPRLLKIDSDLATTLQTAPGKLVRQTSTYTLTEIVLAEPREIQLRGEKTILRSAFRLIIKLGSSATDSDARIDLIWIKDAAVPAFRRLTSGGSEVGGIIYDEAVLKNGAELAVSNLEATKVTLLSDRLEYQSGAGVAKAGPAVVRERAKVDSADAGNTVVGIRNVVRLIGGRRQPLVQINLTTARSFPARDSVLRLQVGKRIFSEELSGDYTGRSLTLMLTPEMFAALQDGADIVAFFNRPDRSGYADGDVWYFGPLNKSSLQ